MKRLVILIILVLVAGFAGIVRSKTSVHFGQLVSHNANTDQVHDQIRQSYALAPGARVEISGINGAVKIETANTKTAEVFIERSASSQEALDRRKITVEADANGLRISSEKNDNGFLGRLFGSNSHEDVTLKLPRQVSLNTKGVNGSVTVGDLEGSVEVRGVNGRVQIASAIGTADLNGINGNIQLGLRQLKNDGVSLSGINGNIELQLNDGVNADFDAHGMNGRVLSDLPGVTVEKDKGGRYSAHIGSGGSSITAKGINGNIRLTRGNFAASLEVPEKDTASQN
jgi:hypothetical protein